MNDCYCALLRVMRSKFPVLKEAWLLVNSRGTDLPDMSLQFVLSHLPESLEDLNLMLWNIYLKGYIVYPMSETSLSAGNFVRYQLSTAMIWIPCSLKKRLRCLKKTGIGKVAHWMLRTVAHGDHELLDFTGYVEAGHICVTEGVY